VRYRVVVHGKVQGVWFRESCRRVADRLGLDGWVTNRGDGTVEAELEGPLGAVAQAVSWCRQGPPSAEVTGVAERLLRDALRFWTPDAGFGFQAPHPTTAGSPATVPGLQGTEMWLSIVWLLADLVGVADQLGYRPRGVHRPEPAIDLADLRT
jgi:acylphosphatase